MSIGSSLSGISFSGLSSGIDTDTIIQRLMQLEALPIQRLQQQQASLASRQGTMLQFKSLVTSVSVAAGSLNNASAFNPISSTSSDTDVASVTATSDAAAGIFELAVSKLAQAHKIATTAQANTTDGLGLSGTFTVNGKGITVEAADSLKTIAQKVNSAQAGVTASIIDGGTGNAYLTLTASTTGAAKEIQIGDLTGSVTSTLGLASGAEALRETIVGGGTSYGFSSSTDKLGTLFGLSGIGSKTFSLNGVNVNVDMDNVSLQGVADAINSAGTGASATVRSVTVDDVTTYKLDITGLTTFTDADGVLKSIGVVQQGFGNEMVTAQDAEFSIDGINLTSEKNSVTTVIPGVTITLLKADQVTPETSTLTFTRDNTAIKGKVKELMNAYNGLADFIKTNSSFDKESFSSGVLFGDSTVRQVESAMSDLVLKDVDGLTGTYTNLTQLGFGFDSDGKMTLDEAKLDAAIAADSAGVGALFRAVGTASTSQITYVSSTSKTKPSTSGAYEVVVTQLAQKAAYEAEGAQTLALASSETLTFNGKLFGDTAYELLLDPGMSQAAVVDKINSDSKLKDLVTASVVGGKLTLTSKKYGTSGDFTIVSDKAAAADSTGVGTVVQLQAGVDIAGTIGGEAATGNGQFLTGNKDNENTEGLQIMYTGVSTGVVGTIGFTKGIGALMVDLAGTFTDSVNGLLTVNDQSLQDQMDTIAESITSLQERLQRKEQELKARFTRMEQAMSQIQGQMAQLSSIGMRR